MKEIVEYLEKHIALLADDSADMGEYYESPISKEIRLAAFLDIYRKINLSKPELHVCPDCMADVAYVRNTVQDTFDLVFVRHNY